MASWNSEGTVIRCRERSGRGRCSFPNKIVLEGAVPRPGDVSGGMCSLWMSRTESVNSHNRNQPPAPGVTTRLRKESLPACVRSHHPPTALSFYFAWCGKGHGHDQYYYTQDGYSSKAFVKEIAKESYPEQGYQNWCYFVFHSWSLLQEQSPGEKVSGLWKIGVAECFQRGSH